MTAPRTRPATLAFYLPQFHPIEQNDEWWEPGFTEWFNVVRAEERYAGQRIGRLPGELGFYDLRLSETRRAQIDLARRAGIDGFMYYHYWFGGQRLLNEPLDRMLATPDEDFPFCLCWANEPWTRRWDGMHDDILVDQMYSAEDDHHHLGWLRTVFADRRYIRIQGRPVVFVYRPLLMPDPAGTTQRWREACRAAGEPEPYLVKFDTYDDDTDPADWGYDAAAEFVPHGSLRAMAAAGNPVSPNADELGDILVPYDELAATITARAQPGWKRYRCTVPNWDNSPRRAQGSATITVGSTPERFAQWIADSQDRAIDDGHELLLINSWNEWAEGAYLEPDAVDGTAYLDALGAVLGPRQSWPTAIDPVPERVPSELDGVTDGRLRARADEMAATLRRRSVHWVLALTKRLRGS